MTAPVALRARYVFTGTGQVIADGVVTIAGGKIVAVGEHASGRRPRDLGNVALLPGLMNAHTHLEFSDLRAPLGERGMSLPRWVEQVIAWRRAQAAPSTLTIERGLHESSAAGVAAIGEIATAGRWTAAIHPPQAVTVFHEVIAPVRARADQAISLAREFVEAQGTWWQRGLSPHAPYTVPLETFARVIEQAARSSLPVASHVTESREELEYLATGAGPFRELFDSLGIEHEARPRHCPLDYLQRLAGAPRALVIHGNYLTEDEIAFVARQRDRMSVVYCPRTHAFFGHEPYPLERMLTAGCNVALGTDSRASNPDLSVLAEMRDVARRFPSLSPETVLEMGTLAGARALGREGTLGSIEPGKAARLAVVPLAEGDAGEPYELLFDSTLPAAPLVIGSTGATE